MACEYDPIAAGAASVEITCRSDDGDFQLAHPKRNATRTRDRRLKECMEIEMMEESVRSTLNRDVVYVGQREASEFPGSTD